MTTAASAIEKRMFSLPVTFFNALISSLVTRRSARAPIRCTVAFNNSTKVVAVTDLLAQAVITTTNR